MSLIPTLNALIAEPPIHQAELAQMNCVKQKWVQVPVQTRVALLSAACTIGCLAMSGMTYWSDHIAVTAVAPLVNTLFMSCGAYYLPWLFARESGSAAKVLGVVEVLSGLSLIFPAGMLGVYGADRIHTQPAVAGVCVGAMIVSIVLQVLGGAKMLKKGIAAHHHLAAERRGQAEEVVLFHRQYATVMVE